MEDFLAKKKVALVHDYLVQDGGAERVLACLQELFPNAPTYVLVHDPARSHPQFRGRDIRTSFVNQLPFMPKHYQWALPLMPIAVEHFDFSPYTLVISSSSSFAKGIIVPPQTKHICYCHTPTRFLWQERIGYVNELPQPKIFRNMLPPLLHHLRMWDRLAAERPDFLITNSQTSQGRIRRYYKRESQVIAPPVDVDHIPLSMSAGSYWLAGGRLVAYKRFDLIVRAFSKLNMPLVIFGIGPEEKKLKKMAGKSIRFMGHVDDATKLELYREAIGFIHPQVEDFGITAVEAMAAGKPVFAFEKGGGAETVIPGVTGEFLDAQSWETIGDAVIRFDAKKYDPVKIRAHAETFSSVRFKNEMLSHLQHLLAPT